MILQTGQRTDIPAFYAPWFIRRLEEGYVRVRNPYHPFQVTEYRFSPESIDFIGFTTKNPRPLLQYWDQLKAYDMLWHVTLTAYGRDMEPHVPPIEQVIEDIQFLSQKLGPKQVVWRFDPVILTDFYTVDYHLEAFQKISQALGGYVDTVITSFVDLYPSVVRLHPDLQRPNPDQAEILLRTMQEISSSHGIHLRTCGEKNRYAHLGIDSSDCYTAQEFERIFGRSFKLPAKGQARSTCSCYLHGDIGAYNTCQHFCRYCYANTETDIVAHNWKLHDPNSPFLIGGDRSEDKISIVADGRWSSKPEPLQESLF
ncbi:MAG: DUF1848 domain-containing protein [Veillonella sp.]|nr:DUF1848 domain-containing protein [Veillonella sp.]